MKTTLGTKLAINKLSMTSFSAHSVGRSDPFNVWVGLSFFTGVENLPLRGIFVPLSQCKNVVPLPDLNQRQLVIITISCSTLLPLFNLPNSTNFVDFFLMSIY